MNRLLIIFVIIFALFSIAPSQPNRDLSSTEIQFAIQKANVLGRVLYLAAHPDDENTGVIAYFSKGRKYRTAYLSLTRGDGGQNLIGPEKGAEIGMIRTQELLQARKLDGGEQFFSRAVDFGYSKTFEETFTFWGKEAILADVVWVIRKFKPDIIITRFPPNSYGGHGHHTASAILAKEAFFAAADTTKFPEQLKWVEPWQTKRMYWNSWRPGQKEREKLLSVNIGEYNPLLGTSYSQISALARSMHKSQGFGVTASRGDRFDYFDLSEGDSVTNDVFQGIDTSWGRVKGGNKIGENLSDVEEQFDSNNPSNSIPKLVESYKQIQTINNDYWKQLKSNELKAIIRSCAGLWMEAIADDYTVAPGHSVNLETTIINRSNHQIQLVDISVDEVNLIKSVNENLPNNQPSKHSFMLTLPKKFSISEPYWLKEPGSPGLFSITNQQQIGLAENNPSPTVRVTLNIDNVLMEYELPIFYRWRDRVAGELYRPLEIRPAVTINPEENVCVFPDSKSKKIKVSLISFADNVAGFLSVNLPADWEVTPSSIPLNLLKKYDETTVEFTVSPPVGAGQVDMTLIADINGEKFNRSLVEINHTHIKHLVHFPKAKTKLVKLDIKLVDGNIGYIMGAGDNMPASLRNLGYTVTELSDADLENIDLSRFDTILTGIRAYNTRSRLQSLHSRLLAYVKNGGTLVVQYNVTAGLLTDQIGPYPFHISRDRVSVEEAKMTILNPGHQLLNFPNKITQKDFKGWVQERGLYFPNTWDSHYDTILSCFDPGESAKKGSILFTRYGEGAFVYTGLSWFRQLPAGVPGAFRLFANLISAGKYNE